MLRIRRLVLPGLALTLAAGGLPVLGQPMILEPVRDNTLVEDLGGALSNGVGEHLFAGTTANGDFRRAVLAFDVAAAIPAGATITSAELRLEMSMTRPGDESWLFELYRVLSDWGEGASNSNMMGGGGGAASTPGDATWLHTFFDTGLWTNPGGDFAAVVSGAKTVGGLGSYTWSSTPQIVADVQGWLDDPATNFGWLLQGDETASSNAKRFNSRENSDPSTVPRLIVSFELLIFADGFESGDTTGWD